MDKLKSKRIVAIILVIAVLFALAAVAVAYYYFNIKDLNPQGSNSTQGCGCYFAVATSNTKSCAGMTPKSAFEFRTGTKQDNGTCSANCDLRTVSPLSSTVGENPEVLACKVDSFTNTPGCVDLSIQDQKGDRYANKITPETAVTLQAKFVTPSSITTSDTEFYKSFSFVVNGEKINVDSANITTNGEGLDKVYTISTQVKDYKNADKLTVQAFGESQTNASITAESCLRELQIVKATEASCSGLDFSFDTSAATPKVKEVAIQLGGLASTPKSLSAKFTLGSLNKVITTTDVTAKYSNGVLTLPQSFLYANSNFTTNENFSVIDSQKDKLTISANIIVDGKSINSESCVGTQSIPQSETENPNNNNNNNNGGTENPDNTPNENNGGTTTTTSSFTVSNSASLSCVERGTTLNSLQYTVTIKNTGTEASDVLSIKDKLPLGFDYIENSTYLNGVAASDASLVTVNTTGSTQDITWQKTDGWSVQANGTLIIQFRAKTTSSTLSGANLNEVVVTPKDTPVNAATLRNQVAVTVAQTCTSPSTGLFDSTVAKVVLSILLLVLGLILYYSELGNRAYLGFENTKIAAVLRLGYLRFTNPRKYFEQRILRKTKK